MSHDVWRNKWWGAATSTPHGTVFRNWLTLASVSGALMLACSSDTAGSWHETLDADAGLRVSFPGPPVDVSDVYDTPAGELTARTFAWPDTSGMSDASGVRFEVTTSRFPLDVESPAVRERILDGARDGILATTDGRLVDEAPRVVADTEGRSITVRVERDAVTLDAWLCLRDGQMVQVLAFADDGSSPDLVERFFGSVRFVSLRH